MKTRTILGLGAIPVWLSICVACQSQLDSPPATNYLEFTSGQRLRGRTIEATGTEPILLGIFDREKQQECRFLPASDGKLRCLPSGAEGLVDTREFADAECRHPIYRPTQPDCGAAPRFVSVARSPSGSCPDPTLYDVHTLEASTPGAHYWRGPGGCVPWDGTPAAGTLTATTLVAATEWVEGDLQLRPKSHQLRVKEVHATDGGRFTVGLVDVRFGWDCNVSLDEAGNGQCLPSTSGASGFFADAACQVPLALSWSACTPPPTLIDGNGAYHAPGQRWEGETFAGAPDHCAPFKLGGGVKVSYYGFGETIVPATDFPRVAAGQTGAGRLTRPTIEAEGTTLIPNPSPTYFDRTLGLPCTPSHTSAGLRCLAYPSGVFGATAEAYADAACSQPLIQCGDCEGAEVAIAGAPRCGATDTLSLRRVGAKHAGQVYRLSERAGGARVCAGPVDATQPKGQPLVLNGLGAETSFDRFAPLDERTE